MNFVVFKQLNTFTFVDFLLVGDKMFWEIFYKLCTDKNTKPLSVVKELKIATGIITKWKNGSIPNGETLIKLADFFDCSVDHLLGRDKDSSLSKKEQLLLSEYNSKPEMQPAVDKLLGIDSNTEEKKYNPTIDFTAPPLEIAAWGADGTEAEYRLPIEETT